MSLRGDIGARTSSVCSWGDAGAAERLDATRRDGRDEVCIAELSLRGGSMACVASSVVDQKSEQRVTQAVSGSTRHVISRLSNLLCAVYLVCPNGAISGRGRSRAGRKPVTLATKMHERDCSKNGSNVCKGGSDVGASARRHGPSEETIQKQSSNNSGCGEQPQKVTNLR